jgi:hypothetical protein
MVLQNGGMELGTSSCNIFGKVDEVQEPIIHLSYLRFGWRYRQSGYNWKGKWSRGRYHPSSILWSVRSWLTCGHTPITYRKSKKERVTKKGPIFTVVWKPWLQKVVRQKCGNESHGTLNNIIYLTIIAVTQAQLDKSVENSKTLHVNNS